jgi:hypothetical protein
MPYQAERTEAVAFLEEVARQPTPAGRENLSVTEDVPMRRPGPGVAVSTLADMGPQGEAALRRLHAQGAVQDPRTRAAAGSEERDRKEKVSHSSGNHFADTGWPKTEKRLAKAALSPELGRRIHARVLTRKAVFSDPFGLRPCKDVREDWNNKYKEWKSDWYRYHRFHGQDRATEGHFEELEGRKINLDRLSKEFETCAKDKDEDNDYRPPGLESLLASIRAPLPAWQVPKPGPRPRLDFTIAPPDAVSVRNARAVSTAAGVTAVGLAALWWLLIAPVAAVVP